MSRETGQEGSACDMVCSLGLFTFIIFTFIPRPDDEEADQVQAAVGCAKISQFFGAKPTPKTRHRFFQERGLKTVTSEDF